MKYTTLFLLLFLFSCSSDETPRVVYPQRVQTDSINTTTPDLSKMERNLYMEFPFAFDSTSAYIFPVRNAYDKRGRYSYKLKSGFSSTGGYEYEFNDKSVRYNNRIGGWFYNFLFQDLPSENLRKLTEQEMRFSQLTIFRDTINDKPYPILLLDAFDLDSNQDKVLSFDDLRSLYVCDIDGKNLRKITPQNHLILNEKFDKRTHRIYFNTIKDADKDGEFLKNDPRHYYYFEILTRKVKEYYMPQ